MRPNVVALYAYCCILSQCAWRGEGLVHGLLLKEGSNPVEQYLTDRSSVQTQDGHSYSLESNSIEPFFALYNDEIYAPAQNGSVSAVVNKLTGELEEVFVYKGKYEDGSRALLVQDSEHNIQYVQIKQSPTLHQGSVSFLPNNPRLTNHFLRDGPAGKLLRFTDDDYDFEAMARGPTFTDTLKPNPTFHRELTTNITADPFFRRLHSYKSGDGHSKDCVSFKTIPISIIYDHEFCTLHGGTANSATSSVQGIMAYASAFYEDDMCVRLTLTSIMGDCDASQARVAPYQDSDKKDCNGFLDMFSLDMMERRSTLGIDPKSIIHLWTGAEVRGTLGCAWYPGLCDQTHGYGVDFMAYQFPDIPARAFIFGHELGHNLNAIHDDLDSNRKTLMAKTPNDASDGFSTESIETIMTHILTRGSSCVGEWRPPLPTQQPTRRPTPRPIREPSWTPTRAPTRPVIPASTGSPSIESTPSQTVTPTSLPTPMPTDSPVQDPTSTPTPRPTPRPSPNPTPRPSPNPTPSPTSEEISTPFPSLSSAVPTVEKGQSAAPEANVASGSDAVCTLDRFFVDPLCIAASYSGNDYVCVEKDEVFQGGCNAGLSITVDTCGYEFMDATTSVQTDRRLLEVADPYEAEYLNQVPVLFLEREATKGDALPMCSESCSEVGGKICFRAWTANGFDRWYKVDLTVSDGSGAFQSFGMFAVVKDEEGSASCKNDYLVCSKEVNRT